MKDFPREWIRKFGCNERYDNVARA